MAEPFKSVVEGPLRFKRPGGFGFFTAPEVVVPAVVQGLHPGRLPRVGGTKAKCRWAAAPLCPWSEPWPNGAEPEASKQRLTQSCFALRENDSPPVTPRG